MAKGRRDQLVHIVARLVTQWINAIKSMVFHQALSSNKPFMAHQVSSNVLLIAPPIASLVHHQTAFTPEQY